MVLRMQPAYTRARTVVCLRTRTGGPKGRRNLSWTYPALGDFSGLDIGMASAFCTVPWLRVASIIPWGSFILFYFYDGSLALA